MKLRNKKTGEIIDKICIHICSFDTPKKECKEIDTEARSLKKVLETWEDYKPKEPLIKNKKIRKAVRTWAEANGYSLVKIGYDMASEPNNGLLQIHFEGAGIVDDDEFGIHTIAELCGEEGE